MHFPKKTRAILALALLSLCSCQPLLHRERAVLKDYSGKLDDTDPILLMLRFSGENGRGTCVHADTGKTNLLEGVGDETAWQLVEYSAPGSPVGHFSLKPRGHAALSGTWVSRSGSTERSVWVHEVANNLEGSDVNGRWVDESGLCRLDLLRLADGRVLFQGLATWHASNTVNTGTVRGLEPVVNGEIQYVAEGGEPGCRLLILLGNDRLDVKDNVRCGGFNVSFTGVYRKASARTGDWEP